MDDLEWFRDRMVALRTQKGVSARDMSLSLGQSESYVNKIENQRALPSMQSFFYICEYFGITPGEFFDAGQKNPRCTKEIADELGKLPSDQAEHVLLLIRDLNKK